MKSMKITCASILLSCVANSWQAYAMEPPTPSHISGHEEKIPMSIGQECPFEKISDLPELRYLKSAKKLPAIEQGANSTVYQLNDQIIKVSKIVEPATQLSKELEDQQRMYAKLSPLKGFDFAIPQKTYKIRSTDNNGMCFVEISQALLPENKINQRYYQHIDTNVDNRTIFFDLGKALAQLQNSMPQTLENGFYYGIQNGDFQIGNIFYDPYKHIFTLIDLGTFAEHKRLILDPLYFIYFFSVTYGKHERFIEKLRNETAKTKISNLITAFITGYVSNLNPDVAKQMNKAIQENNPTDLFYLGGRYLYPKGEVNIIQAARKKIELADFFNPIIRQAFATAYINTSGKNVGAPKPVLKPTAVPAPAQAPQLPKNKDFSIKSLMQLPDLCKADTVKLDLSMYPELEDLTGISACENLKKLYLHGTKVSNIEEIASLKNLEELDLSSVQVDDKGIWILPLAGYTDYHGSIIKTHRYPGTQKLKILKVYGIKKIHGYHELEKELPDLEIKTSSNTEKY